MSNLAFRDFSDLNLDDPDTAIAKVVEELARAGVRHAGKSCPRIVNGRFGLLSA
jgi:hypothetical protein